MALDIQKSRRKWVLLQELPADIVEQPAQHFDRMDEEQIAKMIMNEVVKTYVYRFRMKDGREVVGLSFAGVKAWILRRGSIEIMNYDIEYDPRSNQWHATVKVRDMVRWIDALGTASCEADKPFARVIALNKALRNAWRHLIPEKQISAIIDFYLRKEEKKQPIS
ncbi:MAG: hypothetical protein QXQ33_00725 [Nitrososphaerota archaeon]